MQKAYYKLGAAAESYSNGALEMVITKKTIGSIDARLKNDPSLLSAVKHGHIIEVTEEQLEVLKGEGFTIYGEVAEAPKEAAKQADAGNGAQGGNDDDEDEDDDPEVVKSKATLIEWLNDEDNEVEEEDLKGLDKKNKDELIAIYRKYR